MTTSRPTRLSPTPARRPAAVRLLRATPQPCATRPRVITRPATRRGRQLTTGRGHIVAACFGAGISRAPVAARGPRPPRRWRRSPVRGRRSMRSSSASASIQLWLPEAGGPAALKNREHRTLVAPLSTRSQRRSAPARHRVREPCTTKPPSKAATSADDHLRPATRRRLAHPNPRMLPGALPPTPHTRPPHRAARKPGCDHGVLRSVCRLVLAQRRAGTSQTDLTCQSLDHKPRHTLVDPPSRFAHPSDLASRSNDCQHDNFSQDRRRDWRR